MSKKTFGPYSAVRRAGNFYFISGQVGIETSSGNCPMNIEEQTRQAMQNLKSRLSDHSLGMDEVVKTTVFLTDMANFAPMNEVYASFFTGSPPARSCVGVSALPRFPGKGNLLIEIEAVAYCETASEGTCR